MVGQIVNNRFDILIGDGRIPDRDHTPYQRIPITSIPAGALGDVLPDATGVVTSCAVQGDQRLALVIGQERIQLVIRIGSDDVASSGSASGSGFEVRC